MKRTSLIRTSISRKKAKPVSVKKNERDRQQAYGFGCISIILSGLALLGSGLSIYFAHFYEDRSVAISFIGGEVKQKSIMPAIIYFNKGNKSATIIENKIIFHQKQKDIERNGLSFKLFELTEEDSLQYEPFVVSPSEQVIRKFKQNVYFSKTYQSDSLDLGDTIKVSLYVSYINTRGLAESNVFPLGHVVLDSHWKIKSYRFNLFSKELDSEYHTASISSNKVD